MSIESTKYTSIEEIIENYLDAYWGGFFGYSSISAIYLKFKEDVTIPKCLSRVYNICGEKDANTIINFVLNYPKFREKYIRLDKKKLLAEVTRLININQLSEILSDLFNGHVAGRLGQSFIEESHRLEIKDINYQRLVKQITAIAELHHSKELE